MKKIHFLKKRTVIIWIVIFTFIMASAKKIFDYAAPPFAPKDCDFIFPKQNDAKPTTISIKPPRHSMVFLQNGGTVNDASCLNKTPVYGIVNIHTEEDIRHALQFAGENHLKVSMAGQKHSMGGQAFVKNGLVLNMKNFNKTKLDKERKIINVQAGTTWAQIQTLLDQAGLAVKAMQSINIFTVGGTLSVNAHGIAHDPGQIATTIKSFRIMLSDGTIKTASQTQNSELFRLALGGYGLFGVILDADISVTDNEMYEWKTNSINYKDFPEYFRKHIEDNNEIGLMYGRLSVSPVSYLTQTAIHTYTKIKFDETLPLLEPEEHTWLNRLVINFSKTGGFGKWIRWTLEKYVEPKLHTCFSRNQAMSQKELCLVSRNQEMYDSMGYLKNRLDDTDILQEYFIPHDNMPDFVDGLRNTVQKNGANLLNVTIRIVKKDTITALPYAREDMFAFVLYFNQKLNEEESIILQKTTTDLIDLALSLNGTFYLPYQLYYSAEQLRTAYPNIDTFFTSKKKYDSGGLFSNTFYEKYGAN